MVIMVAWLWVACCWWPTRSVCRGREGARAGERSHKLVQRARARRRVGVVIGIALSLSKVQLAPSSSFVTTLGPHYIGKLLTQRNERARPARARTPSSFVAKTNRHQHGPSRGLINMRRGGRDLAAALARAAALAASTGQAPSLAPASAAALRPLTAAATATSGGRAPSAEQQPPSSLALAAAVSAAAATAATAAAASSSGDTPAPAHAASSWSAASRFRARADAPTAPSPPPASGAPAAVDPTTGLTNNPLDYDPIMNEHTAAMTLARKAATEYMAAGR